MGDGLKRAFAATKAMRKKRVTDVRDIPHYYRCKRHLRACDCHASGGLHEADCPSSERNNASGGLDCHLCCEERDAAVDALVETSSEVADRLRQTGSFRDDSLARLCAALAKFGVSP